MEDNNLLPRAIDISSHRHAGYEYLMPETPSQNLQRRLKLYDSYSKRAEGILENLNAYNCPIDIYDRIQKESKDLLYSNMIDEENLFSDLLSFLQTQKQNLSLLKSRVDSNSGYFENVSTLIVNVTVFHIEEGLDFFEKVMTQNGADYMRRSIVEFKRKKILQRVWDAVKYLDTFYMQYEYKQMVYNNKREEWKHKCKGCGIDIRTKEQVKKENINDAVDSGVSCLIQLAIPIIIFMILAFILGKS